MMSFFRKKEKPLIIKDLGSIAKLNREREKKRKTEQYASMFNEMLEDIQTNLSQGNNFVKYAYTEERLLCVNHNRLAFQVWGARHNLEISVSVFNNYNPPVIYIDLKEIQ